MAKTGKQATNSKILPGSKQASETIWKSVARIQEKWELNAAQMARLLHVKPPTFHNWKHQAEIPISAELTPDIELIIAVIAIYRSLSAMFASPKDQVAWLNSKHPQLQAIPIKFAESSSSNLFQLRSYLDFVRGRGA